MRVPCGGGAAHAGEQAGQLQRRREPVGDAHVREPDLADERQPRVLGRVQRLAHAEDVAHDVLRRVAQLAQLCDYLWAVTTC